MMLARSRSQKPFNIFRSYPWARESATSCSSNWRSRRRNCSIDEQESGTAVSSVCDDGGNVSAPFCRRGVFGVRSVRWRRLARPVSRSRGCSRPLPVRNASRTAAISARRLGEEQAPRDNVSRPNHRQRPTDDRARLHRARLEPDPGVTPDQEADRERLAASPPRPRRRSPRSSTT